MATIRYVTPAGGGAHDGTTYADAFTLGEAVTDINGAGAGGRAAYDYYLIGSFSLSASITITGGGSAAGGPCRLIGGTWNGSAFVDGYAGRTGGTLAGALITTNFATLAFDATYLLSITTCGWIIIQNCTVTGSRNGALVVLDYTRVSLENCAATNVGSGAGAIGVTQSSSETNLTNCDIVASGGTSLAAVNADPYINGSSIDKCRVSAPNSIGLRLAIGCMPISNTVIYTCVTGVSTLATTDIYSTFVNLTVVNCAVGYSARNAAAGLPTIFRNCIFLGCGSTAVFSNPYAATANNPLDVQNCYIGGYTNIVPAGANQFAGWIDTWGYVDGGAALDPATVTVNWAGGDYTPTGAFARAYPGIGAIDYRPTLPAVEDVEDAVLYGVDEEYEGTLVGGGGGATPLYGDKTGGR